MEYKGKGALYRSGNLFFPIVVALNQSLTRLHKTAVFNHTCGEQRIRQSLTPSSAGTLGLT